MRERRRSEDLILLAHGSGGRLTHRLVRDLFLRHFANDLLAPLEDAARLSVGGVRLAFTTDSFVVTPISFPGGDLGKLSICGTVNDLAVMGARPIALSAGFVIEEGFPIDRLDAIAASMQAVCVEVGVSIVTGDTKVVERGGCDQLFINTAGVGVLEEPLPQGAGAVRPGDQVIVTGSLADHGIAVMAARNDLGFDARIESDCAPIVSAARALLESGIPVRWMRDPTRGGLATTLNELTAGAPFAIEIDEDRIPVRREVQALSDILGLDPLYVPSEGRFVAVVEGSSADRALAALQSDPAAREAAVIGAILADPPGRLLLRTRVGGGRILEMLTGDQLPRIC